VADCVMIATKGWERMARKLIDKPRNGGKWTESKFRSFVISQLRRARWPAKYEAIARAYVGMGTNPATGRRCKLHKCEQCGGIFAKGDMRADHRVPIVDPATGFVDWNTWIARCFVEAAEFDVICVECHAAKTAEERAIATARRKKEKEANK